MENANLKPETPGTADIILEDIILFDWLSVSSTVDIPENFIEFLGLDELEFEEVNGYYGYRNRYYYDGISIHYDYRGADEGERNCLLEISGQGCRVFETYGNGDWKKLFSRFLSDGYNITRLDVAYDDHTGNTPSKRGRFSE